MANKASFTTPKHKRVLTVSTGAAISVYSPDDSSGALYVNAVSTVSLSTTAGVHTGTWTPGSTAANYVLTFVGNVTGVSDPITVTVDVANVQDIVLTNYTKSNVNIATTAIPSPGGNGNMYLVTPTGSCSARRLFYKDPSAGTALQKVTGLDVWILGKSGSVTNYLGASLGSGGVINPQNGYSIGQYGYVTVVETIFNYYGGMNAYRVQYRLTDAAGAAGTNCYLDLMQDTQNNTYTLAAPDLAGAGIYISEPRRVRDVALPFTPADRMTGFVDAAASTALGVTNGYVLYYKHNWVDTETAMNGGSLSATKVLFILPSNYSPTGNHAALFITRAQSDGAESGHPTAWDTAKDATADYANTCTPEGTVVIVGDEAAPEGYWGGVKSDGSKNMFDFYPDVLLPYFIKNFGVSPDREDHLGASYSKGANFWFGQIVLKPYAWGQIGGGDGAYLNVYPGANANLNYSNSTDYNAHDAYQQIPTHLASITGNARICLFGGFTWGADLAAMKSLLDSYGINYTYSNTAWTYHGFGPTGINTGWFPPMIRAMFVNRARIKAARPKQSMFLG